MSNKLEFYARPLIAFDPADKQHRQWYYEFLEYGGWGKCPVRFICPESVGYDLTIMIRNQLIEYYVNKEFNKPEPTIVVRKQRKMVAQKRPKTVDNSPKR